MNEESSAVTTLQTVSDSKTTFSLAPKDLEQAIKFAEMMSTSSIIPKDFVGNPGNILVAVQWGMELGLQPMQAMQNIAVINGRPSLWGDAVIGLVRSSPLCEYIIEEEMEGKSICRVKRRGEGEQIRIFTDDDAKKANLLGKAGPWTQYPKRMRQMRARSWALRDVFPDVLRGMPIAEEVMDMEKNITPHPQRLSGTAAAQAAAVVPEDSDERDNLIADLEIIAKEQGPEAYEKCWKGLTKEQRTMVGKDAHERLKKLAIPDAVVTHDEGHDHE